MHDAVEAEVQIGLVELEQLLQQGLQLFVFLAHAVSSLLMMFMCGRAPVPADQLAAHDDASLGEADLLADLRYPVPPGLSQGGREESGADVAFAEAFFVHCDQSFASTGAAGAPCGKHRSRSSPMVRPASFASRQVV